MQATTAGAAGEGSAAGPTASSLLLGSASNVADLQRALQIAADSIADFDESSRRWTAYHVNGKHPIVGAAWQDHLEFAARHGQAVRGLRGLKNSIQKELGWLEKSTDAQTPTTHSSASSNASFLCALWHHALYSAVNEGPLVALDASFPVASPSSEKAAKIDIVCNGGKTWVRVASIKAFTLLAEFRQAESYIPGDDHSDDEDEDNVRAEQPTAESSRANMEAQLAAHQLDSAAQSCSLIRMAEEINSARIEHDKSSAHKVTEVQLVLSRLSLRSSSPELSSKFYDAAEEHRYLSRLAAIEKKLEQLNIRLVPAEKRTFSGSDLPRIHDPPHAKSWTPTTVLNLDLSALVAIVSSISHMRFPTRIEDTDKCFSRVHWKQTESNRDALADDANVSADEAASSAEDKGTRLQGEDGATLQHARALSEQLQREMSGETFFETLIHHLPIGCGKLQLTCTREAREKMRDILALVGGEAEQRRMHDIFDTEGDNAYRLWQDSRWNADGPRERRVRNSIMLPVVIVDETQAANASTPPMPSSVLPSEFAKAGITSIRDAITIVGSNKKDSISNRQGIHRQTRHTLTSLLIGLVNGQTTITTNINSVKWLVKDIAAAQGMRGEAQGYSSGDENAVARAGPSSVQIAAMWVTYPRSLAEKMILNEALDNSSDHMAMTAPSDLRTTAGAYEIEASMEHGSETAVAADNLDKSDYKYRKLEQRSASSNSSEQISGIPIVLQNGDLHHSNMARRRLARPFRAFARWFKGPRPKSVLEIKHYKWWPLGGVERTWMRFTRPLAWKDPYGTDELAGMVSPASSRDIEYQGSSRKLRERFAELEDDEPWLAGVKRDWKLNWLHWTALVITFIAWILGFAFLVKSLWYEATIVSPDGQTSSNVDFFGCTTTLWTSNSNCGLNGLDCAPFSSNTSLSFRCPSNCQTTKLGGTRAVGDQLPSWEPLVVGGGSLVDASSGTLSPSSYIYRGDSFICSAAIHAGVLPRDKGGCANLWITGAYSGYEAVERNGLQSTAFNSTFPLSFIFDTSVHGEKCTDRRSGGYILDVILLAFVGFVLRPKPIVYFFTLITVGFWHINFVSEPREYPMSVGDPMGDFLPTLFVGYALWRLNFRYLWPAFSKMPLEFNVWLQGFYWLGTLLDVVFVNLPLQRLVLSDIESEPGALTSLIIIIVVVFVLAINQVRVIRKVGKLPKYISLAVVGGVIIGLLAAIPTTGFRLHHYIVALVLLPYCAFETRLSLMYSAFLLGMFLNGVGRWSFDGIIQDISVIIGSGLTGSALPTFASAANWTGVAPYSTLSGSSDPASAGLIHWEPLTSSAAQVYDSFQLLVDDVLRLQSTATYFNLTLLPLYYLGSVATAIGSNITSGSSTLSPSRSTDISDALLSSTQTNLTFYPGGDTDSNVVETLARQPHYLRLAYYNSNSGNLGDFTKAATVYFNGTFVAPASGAT